MLVYCFGVPFARSSPSSCNRVFATSAGFVNCRGRPGLSRQCARGTRRELTVTATQAPRAPDTKPSKVESLYWGGTEPAAVDLLVEAISVHRAACVERRSEPGSGVVRGMTSLELGSKTSIWPALTV